MTKFLNFFVKAVGVIVIAAIAAGLLILLLSSLGFGPKMSRAQSCPAGSHFNATLNRCVSAVPDLTPATKPYSGAECMWGEQAPAGTVQVCVQPIWDALLANARTVLGNWIFQGTLRAVGPVETPWYTCASNSACTLGVSTSMQEHICVDLRNGSVTALLESAPPDGRHHVLKDCFRKATASVVMTVQAGAGDSIEGAASQPFTAVGADAVVTYHAASANWNLE